MKILMLATAAMTAGLAQPAPAPPADDAVKAVTTWIDKFNAGDMNAFFAGHAPNPVLIDEFPPYVWSGKDAPQLWAQGFEADATAHSITEPHMIIGRRRAPKATANRPTSSCRPSIASSRQESRCRPRGR
jgi:hypothetical protein